MNKNNSQSMATVVETYFIEETIDLIHDNDALTKWHEKIEELGLEGQKAVVTTDKSPIPFLWMNESIVNTFELLCPSKIEISKYDKSPIPVELLEIVGLCKKEDYFNKIEVWFNEKQKDPAIIGYKFREDKIHEGEWYQNYYASKYLIGRWADVKASLDQLVERAKKLFIHSETIRLKQEIKDSQRKLEDLETSAENKFGGALPVTDNLPF